MRFVYLSSCFNGVPQQQFGRCLSSQIVSKSRTSVDPSGSDGPTEIDFEDPVAAFGNKSTWEIVRALAVLKACSAKVLVNNSLVMLRWSGGLMKPVFYDQFVGGENPKEISACVQGLARQGLRAMLAATMEEDVGEGGNEAVYDENCQRILDSIEMASTGSTPSPMVQLKLSGLLQADLLVALGNKYASSPHKLKLINAVAEGMTSHQIDASPFADILDGKRRESLNRAVQRLKTISQAAKSQGVKVLVDAEYTYLNPGMSLLTMAAAGVYNREGPVIWNTYQCYLKNAHQKLAEESHLLLEDLGVHFGAKVVRGAYMVHERNRAHKLNWPDPVCDDYQATSDNYNSVLQLLLKRTSEMGDRCQFIVASHNEQSVKMAIKRMQDLNIDKQRGGVCFGQLYGMCDQVSNPLANAGYAVYKSIPFGTVHEVLPYLARRAVENQSVLEGARKEKDLLNKELRRRIAIAFLPRRKSASANA